MQTPFTTLCTELCELAGTPLAKSQTEGSWTRLPVEIDGVKIMLSSNDENPDNLLVVGLLGAVPARDELATIRTVLAANFYLASNSASAFSRHPQTGEIMFQYSRGISGCSPHDLHDSCKHLVQLSQALMSGAFGAGAASVAKSVDVARLA